MRHYPPRCLPRIASNHAMNAGVRCAGAAGDSTFTRRVGRSVQATDARHELRWDASGAGICRPTRRGYSAFRGPVTLDGRGAVSVQLQIEVNMRQLELAGTVQRIAFPTGHTGHAQVGVLLN
jgi:hypothetical protein